MVLCYIENSHMEAEYFFFQIENDNLLFETKITHSSSMRDFSSQPHQRSKSGRDEWGAHHNPSLRLGEKNHFEERDRKTFLLFAVSRLSALAIRAHAGKGKIGCHVAGLPSEKSGQPKKKVTPILKMPQYERPSPFLQSN